jgi:restriction endonuclease S subunit
MMFPLGNVADVSTGYPFRKKVEPEEGGDVVLVQLKDMDGAEGVSGAGTITLRNDGGKYERYLLHEGDLLFQSRGSRHPVAVVSAGIRGIAASGLHTIRPHRGRVLPEYLAWWLNHPVSQDTLISKVARGQYIPFVSKADLLAFLVPVPSLAVQERIVAVDRLHRQERALRKRLETLTEQLVDDVTFAAADRTP